MAAALLLLWRSAEAASGPPGFSGFGPGTSMPEVERWSLPVLAGCALLHAVVVVSVLRRVQRRRAVPGVSTHLDAALRAVQVRRALSGALAGDLVLTAVLLSTVPLLALPDGPSPTLVRVVALVAAVVVAVALVVLAVLLSRWGAPAVGAPPVRSGAPDQAVDAVAHRAG